MNRGSRNSDLRNMLAAARFNEAPIHESGKYLWVSHSKSTKS